MTETAKLEEDKFMPQGYARIIPRLLIQWALLLAALTLISPNPASAFDTACAGQQQPSFTYDGFPVFNPLTCGGSIYSNNGKDTFGDSTCGGNPQGCVVTDMGAGYQCFELANRYFQFKFHVSVSGAVAADLCPGGAGRWNPSAGAQYTKNPVPGDLIVYSQGSASSCPGLGIGPAGHVAVVNAVHGNTVDTVNQNWGVASGVANNVPVSCACAFIHAVNNNATANACNSPSPTGNFTTACPEQQPPLAFTADGYPAFNQNMCLNSGNLVPVASIDGKNTYNARTGQAYINGVLQPKTYPVLPGPAWGAGPVGAAANAPYQSWFSGYMCDELAHRYFHFAHHVDITYSDYPYRLCPQDGSGTWTPLNGAVRASVPSAGDVVVYAADFPGVSINSPDCNYPAVAPASHIAVVSKIYNGGAQFDAVNEHFGITGPGGQQMHDPGIWPAPAGHINAACACTFIHATGAATGTSSGGPACTAVNCKPEPLALSIFQTGPAAAFNSDGGLDVFVRDPDGSLEHKSQAVKNGANTGWEPNWTNLGGSMNSDPVVVTRGNSANIPKPAGNLDVFFIGSDYAVWRIAQNGKTWGTAARVDGQPQDTPVSVPAGGQVSVAYNPATDTEQPFYKGKDGSLMTYIPQGPDKWSAKPTALLKAKSVTSNITTYYDPKSRQTYLFLRGEDGSAQVALLSAGGTLASAPRSISALRSVTSNIMVANDNGAGGGPAAFFRGPDYAIWEVPPMCGSASSACTAWGHPTSLGVADTSDLSLGYLPNGGIRVYYRSTDQGIFFVQQQGTAWSKHYHLLGQTQQVPDSSGVTLLKQALFSNIASVVNSDGHGEVFFIGYDGAVWHTWETTPPTAATPYPNWAYPQQSLGGNFPECASPNMP